MKIHGYDAVGETYGKLDFKHSQTNSITTPLCSAIHEIVGKYRYLSWTLLIITQRSYPRTEDEETKTNNVWLKGHTGKII